MHRLLAAAVAAVLVATAGTALAARGDPQKKLTPADNARARAMLLKKSDLAPGFKVTPSSPEADFYCKALDESDLTLAGEAESPSFARSFVYVSSAVQVYESLADASTSWRRGTSAAGGRCARDFFRREFAKQNIRLESFRRVSFPKTADRSAAWRIKLSGQSQGITVPLVMDVVALMESRAHVSLAFVGMEAVPRAEQLPLVRLVAQRMEKAMRGA